MKPVEILSMIEEAAGTKTYDIKKANALKTIEHKNSKLNEIERVLKEDITPAIEKLKQERSAYIEYQKCEREYLHLHKISLAFQFYQSEQIVIKNKLDREDLEKEFDLNKTKSSDFKKQIEDLKKEINDFVDNMDKSENDDLMNRFEAELKHNRMETAKLNSELNNLKSNINTDNKRENEIKKCIAEVSIKVFFFVKKFI